MVGRNKNARKFYNQSTRHLPKKLQAVPIKGKNKLRVRYIHHPIDRPTQTQRPQLIVYYSQNITT